MTEKVELDEVEEEVAVDEKELDGKWEGREGVQRMSSVGKEGKRRVGVKGSRRKR